MEHHKVCVSVVVPIYNTAAYLTECLSSIASQSFPDFEVWMIDDGSTDQSGEIAQAFAEQDSRFHLIHQENRGLSGARNAGILMCSGEYLSFVDSDDRVDSNYLLRLYETAEKEKADIVCCNFSQYFPRSGRLKRCLIQKPAGIYDGISATRSLVHDVLLRSYVWNKLWRRRLFTDHNIRFLSMRYEDMVIGPQLFSFASRVVVIPDVLYYYTQRWGSLSLQVDEAGLNDYVRTYGLERCFFEEQGLYGQYKVSLRFLKYKTYPFTFGWLVLLQLKKRQLRTLPRNWKRMADFYAYFSADQPIELSTSDLLLQEPVCQIIMEKGRRIVV